MKLYGHPISGNSHRVKNFLSILGEPYEDVIVDLSGGAHKQPEFLAINPLGQVPVLQDRELVLRDSTAILVYLARTYDNANEWLPVDASSLAQVQQWLSIAVNEIQAGPFAVRAVKLFGAPLDYDRAYEKTEKLFSSLFEPHLLISDWLVGDYPTIADIACYSYIACVTEGAFNLQPYPALRRWLDRVGTIPGFSPMPTAKEVFG